MTECESIIKSTKIGFIGCGNMAIAIIQGLIKSGVSSRNLMASNPSQAKLESANQEFGIRVTASNIECFNFADLVILSIKPQRLPQVCEQLRNESSKNKIIVSIAAGISTDKIAYLLATQTAIVRAMPNTPATISKAATGLFANSSTSDRQKQQVEAIFGSIGIAEWVNDESLINVVTAISGSAPAYVFQFIKAMTDQAIASGLSPNTARKLATEAVIGSGELAKARLMTDLDSLTHAVTSPGGTTAAALASFEQDDFSNIIKKAVSAAINRGIELGEDA